MPPDISSELRQRKNVSDPALKSVASSDTTVQSLHSLASTHVAIDGVVYDLNSFTHPGGDTIFMFGGNDVTAQYRMIHPYHTGKNLEKLTRVGKVADYVPEYKFDTDFEREIKREVFAIVHRGREFGTNGWFLRAAAYICLFFYTEYLFAFYTCCWTAIAVGVSMALIGLNVQHDANHGACSKKPWVNDMLGLFCDMIGNSRWLWMEKHWTHHAYTNHVEKDPDTDAAEPVLLFHNYPLQHAARAWYHRYQAWLLVPVLAGYWVSSVFHPQVFDLQDRGAASKGLRMDNAYIRSKVPIATGIRIAYHFWNVFLPFYYAGGLNWTTFGHIMLMGVAGSLTLAVLFTLSHNFEHVDRDPTRTTDDDASKELVCWYKAQVETSCTYGGTLSGWLSGGLNFQVEHHCFPRMSSAWYPVIAPTVRRICAKHGVRYVYYPWLWQNIISTVKYVHKTGTGIHWETQPLSGRA